MPGYSDPPHYARPPSISHLRKTSGLTWGEFARLANVPKAQLSRWCKGEPVTSSRDRRRLTQIAAGIWHLPADTPEARRALILEHLTEHGEWPTPDAPKENTPT